MSIYKYYVDNVSGATGNGGTGPDDAHISFQEAFDGISAGGYVNNEDLILIYVKNTGVTYTEEGVDVSSLSGYEIKISGTNSSFVEDGSKPVISNSSDYFIDSTFGGTMYWSNFSFNTTYTNSIINFQSLSWLNFLNCDFEGNSTANYAAGSLNSQSILGTYVNCSLKNFNTAVHAGGSNRANPNFVYCYFKNADPWRPGCGNSQHWLVNCILEDSHVQDSHYDNKHLINNLFYGSNGTEPQVRFGDRTTSQNYHLLVNNMFVDAPGYAINTPSTTDSETYLFYNNFFHGAVSGNFDMNNNFDSSIYYGITVGSGDPIFVDEVAGGITGFVPLSTSPTVNIGVWNTDIGPLDSEFTTSDTGSLSLGTGGIGDIVTVSGRSFQKVDDDPIVWRRTTV